MIEEKHIPNLLIANKLCMLCVSVWKTKKQHNECESNCGVKEFNSKEVFAEWLFTNNGYIAMAHNMSYDDFFDAIHRRKHHN